MVTRNPDADSLAAWCCAHYPTSCDGHGFAETETAATVETIRHYVGVHQ